LKQAVELGLPKNHLIAALDLEPLDVHSLGVQMLQGIYLTESWYWDQSDATRAFSKRFFEQRHLQPARGSVAMYSETMHYLKAMRAVGSDASGRAIVAKMREMPVSDVYAHNAHLRADGRLIMDMYLVQVKTPAESKNDWDIYNILATVPGEQALRPVSESECPLLRTQN
jgi:branched-chain amino acid transport system substrate-binding protein